MLRGQPANGNRLDNAVHFDGVGQFLQGSFIEMGTRLIGVYLYLLNGDFEHIAGRLLMTYR